MNTNEINESIKEVITALMDKVMDNVLYKDPFIAEIHYANKPLYAALVPDEIFKGSHFERRFVTPFGGAWEKLAVKVGAAYHGECLRSHNIVGTIGKERLRRIQEVLNKLEHRTKGEDKVKPDWNKELAYILKVNGEPAHITVTCDIYINSQRDGKRYAFELKGPLPNSDQTKVSKEKMFKLLAMNERSVDYAYYALVYNPYGKKSDYAWRYPKRWFDMTRDPSVLIGDELWDIIGGSGTYQAFVEEVNKLGIEYRERIYREFLGIEPPQGFDKILLK